MVMYVILVLVKIIFTIIINKDMKKNILKNINILFFIISIIGLIFIGITIYEYKKKIISEELSMVVENLENQDVPDIDSEQNITTEPTEPTDSDKKQPGYLDLKQLSIPSIKDYVVRTVTNSLEGIRPDVQGPPGQMGQKGDIGQNGGTFLFRGPLRSIKQPTLVVDRKTNIPFMNTQTYTPQQSWTMSNDNKIINLSNQNDCFNVNDSGNLEIANCINSEKWNYIGLTGQVKAMKPVGGKNKCLTLRHTPEKGADNQYNILLDDCSIGGPEQAWNFI
jgi:hypothetical protein